MTDRLVDRDYLREEQYASDANLSSRQAIYRFRTPALRTAPWALDLAGLGGDERVADIGCGNGLYLAELQRREHRGPTVGMDLSPGMLTAARNNAVATLVAGDAQDVPFADDTFDCVLAMHMLYHVPDRGRAAAEIARVLRTNGVALVLTNSERHLEELNAMIGAGLHDVTGRDSSAMRAYLRFSSESGGAELSRHFAAVERHDAHGELVVTEVQPIVDYVASMSSVAHVTTGEVDSVLAEVERRARAVIESDGAFRTRTDVGCFVCR